MPQAPMDYRHEFPEPGQYKRTMRAPANCIIIGRTHTLPCFMRLERGRIIVWDENNGTRLLEAGHVELAPAGIRRVGFTLDPVEWVDIFQTDETDVATLERILAVEPPAPPKGLIL